MRPKGLDEIRYSFDFSYPLTKRGRMQGLPLSFEPSELLFSPVFARQRRETGTEVVYGGSERPGPPCRNREPGPSRQRGSGDVRARPSLV